MKDIVIIGAGGFGKEIAWLIERINSKTLSYNIIGYLDDNKPIGCKNGKYLVVGSLDYLKDKEGIAVAVAIGSSKTRHIVVDKIKKINNKAYFPNLIDPSAIYGEWLNIGEGNLICASNILTVDYTIGNFNIINLDCTIGHDAILKDYITLYPSVNISGNVLIDNYSELGTGSQVIQGITIGKNVIVGAGAVVVKNLEDNITAVGSPAKKIKDREVI